MIQLVDVNVLIALIDPGHIYHDCAHDWFAAAADDGWATCPTVENGAVRILGHPKYVGDPGSVAAAASLIAPLLRHPTHRFWPDEISIFADEMVDVGRLGSTGRITDAYLLASAVFRGGKLVTLDRRLSPLGVQGGREALHLIA